jgi:hypothetical protein
MCGVYGTVAVMLAARVASSIITGRWSPSGGLRPGFHAALLEHLGYSKGVLRGIFARDATRKR